MTFLRRLTAALRFTQPELPYCAQCGGHYPAHAH